MSEAAYAVGRSARTGWQGSLPCTARAKAASPPSSTATNRNPLRSMSRRRRWSSCLRTGHFMNSVVMIDVGGSQTRTLPKDVQFHPVTDRPLHVDFLRIAEHATRHGPRAGPLHQRRRLARHQARRRAQHRPPRARAGLRRGRDPRRDRHRPRRPRHRRFDPHQRRSRCPRARSSAIDRPRLHRRHDRRAVRRSRRRRPRTRRRRAKAKSRRPARCRWPARNRPRAAKSKARRCAHRLARLLFGQTGRGAGPAVGAER